ncbi:MAG: hypothetical protein D9V47_06800 [Clostridia bacterium]|nr:MAG: hypothetical protein D9V47_06800 [Clostridia bacterium]
MATLAAAPPAIPFLITGSSDTLEISVRNGSAAAILQAVSGDLVTAEWCLENPENRGWGQVAPRRHGFLSKPGGDGAANRPVVPKYEGGSNAPAAWYQTANRPCSAHAPAR